MSEPLESAARDAHLESALAWLQELSASHSGPTLYATALLAEIEGLRARPTREQALRAMELWAPNQMESRHFDGHTQRMEDCLDAAMREGEA